MNPSHNMLCNIVMLVFCIESCNGDKNGMIRRIANSAQCTFVMIDGGGLLSCGWNKHCQAGLPQSHEKVIVPTVIPNCPCAKKVSCGWNHTLIITGNEILKLLIVDSELVDLTSYVLCCRCWCHCRMWFQLSWTTRLTTCSMSQFMHSANIK